MLVHSMCKITQPPGIRITLNMAAI